MPVKTILITRGISDGEELRDELQQRGHHAIHEPLTEIFLKHTARPELERAIASDPDAIIASSRYGVRALAALCDLRDMPVICVGEATADVANSLGFSRVASAGGNIQSLADYVIDAYDPGSRFLYVSAEHVRADLEQMLSPHGMRIIRLVLYEATASDALSDTLIAQLTRGQVDAATFLSARSADIFMELAGKAGAVETLAQVEAFCLSKQIAERLEKNAWKKIHVADAPTLASLLASVDNAWA